MTQEKEMYTSSARNTSRIRENLLYGYVTGNGHFI